MEVTDGGTKPTVTSGSVESDAQIGNLMSGLKTPDSLDQTIVTKDDLEFMDEPEFEEEDDDGEVDEDHKEENPELYPDEDEDEDEEEDEGEEEEEEEEEEDDTPAPEVKFEPIKPEDMLPKPLAYEEAVTWYEDQLLISSFKSLGYQIGEKGEGLKEAYKDVRDKDPLYLDNLRVRVTNEARKRGEEYRRTKIEPYERQQTEIKVMNVSMQLVKVFPDFFNYTKEMLAAQASLADKYPEILEDPARALPLLYSMAKEKHGAKSSSKGKARTPETKKEPPKMARGRTAPKMRDRGTTSKPNKSGFDLERTFSGSDDPLSFLGG